MRIILMYALVVILLELHILYTNTAQSAENIRCTFSGKELILEVNESNKIHNEVATVVGDLTYRFHIENLNNFNPIDDWVTITDGKHEIIYPLFCKK